MQKVVDAVLTAWSAPILMILAGVAGWFGYRVLAMPRKRDLTVARLGLVATTAIAFLVILRLHLIYG